MDNPIIVNDEKIPLVTYHDKNCGDNNDYDDYNTPNTSRVDEAIFTMPEFTDKQATPTSRLRQKINKISWLHCTGP